MGRIIGIFGGTFDPPHLGHRILAYEAQYELELDRVLWVVTGDPPHKPDRMIANSEHRVRMVSLMIEAEPSFELSRVELDRQPPYYAVDTLQLLRDKWPDAHLVYLMGGDSLMELPSVWHQPLEFVKQVDSLGVMARPSMAIDMDRLKSELPGVETKVHFLSSPLIEISSSLIRTRIGEGKPYKHFLTSSVAEYVEREGLYRY
jgi:nicotinate-nucleotide adenylyltransferase